MAEVLGRAVYVYEADTGPLDKSTAAAKRTVDRAGTQMQASMDRRMASMSKSMGKVGSDMSRHVTLPIVGLGAAAVKFSADFNAAMERVHTQSGASQKEVDKLRGSVLALAKASPQSPTELANALYRLEGAGYRGQKAMDALRASSRLAAIGNANVEDTTKTLTQVMKPGIKGVKDFSDAVGQVNATVGAGDMRLQQLVDALGTGVVTSAKQAGLSFRDVRGALAVFGDETNNVSGWSAQLATALHFITNPTQKAQDALASIGLQSNTLSADFRKPNGLVTALKDLRSHLNETFPPGHGDLSIKQQRDAIEQYKASLEQTGMSADSVKEHVGEFSKQIKENGSAMLQQEQVLGDIFPGGRGRVFTVLLNQVDLLNQKMKQEDKTAKNVGEAYAKTQQTASFKIHQAWSTLQVDAVKLGDALGPDFLKVGEGIANDADKIANAFMRLSPDARETIIKGGLIAAGIGPAMKLASVLLGTVSKIMTAAKTVEGLASGNKSLFGAGAAAKTGTGSTSALSGVSKVATMEVGEMNVAKMLGGGGFGGGGGGTRSYRTTGAIGTTEKAASEVPVAVDEASVMTAVKGAVSRLAGAGMMAGAGVMASQLAGSLAGGKVGSTIKTAGTGASLGAALGTMIEPGIGTAVGAGIGAGVLEGIHLLKKGDYGKQIAGEIFSDRFGGQAAQSLAKQVSSALDDYHKLMSSGTRKQQFFNPFTGQWQDSSKVSAANQLAWKERIEVEGPSKASLAKAQADASRAGNLVARQLERGWNGYKFQSEPTMFEQFVGKAKKLPAASQAAALESAIKFSDTLEAKGRLASGSTNKFIRQVERQFPGLVRYLGLQAGSGADAFRRKLDLSKSQQQLNSQLKKMRGDFPQLTKAMDDAGDDAQKQATNMVKALQSVPTKGSSRMRNRVNDDLMKIADSLKNTRGRTSDATAAMVKAYQHVASNGTGKMRKEAQQDLNALRNTTADRLQKTADSVISQTRRAATSAKSNFNHMQGDATQTMTAVQNRTESGMNKFADAVTTAMANGSLTTGKGMNLLITNLNRALKEMGQKQLSQIQVAVLSSSANNNAQLKAGQTPAGGRRATGGVVNIGQPGKAGQDRVPLNVGGTGIVVGEGEQVAVFNRHQQPIINRALAREGYAGLNGLFNKVRTPNYFARGGIVPRGRRFASGGVVGEVDQFFRAHGFDKTAIAGILGNAMQESRLNPNTPGGGMWQQISNFGGGTGGSLLHQMQVMLPQIIGLRAAMNAASGPGEAAQIFEQGFEKAGIPAMSNRIRYAQEAFAGRLGALAGGGGAGWTDLTAPKVKGSGTIHDIAQAAINMATKAANKYGAAHAPVMSGVGGSGPPTVPAGASKQQVQQAMFAAANHIVGLPYSYGGGHNASFTGSPGYDCSGAVSYVLHAGGFLNSPEAVGAGSGLETFGLPGPGKYITIAGRGSSGENAHTMMSMFGRYFESGGAGGQGPHWDQGWDGSWAVFRHPPGYAGGGIVNGNFGDVPPQVLLKNNPSIKNDPAFKEYARKRGMVSFAQGGLVPFAKGGKPKPSGRQKAPVATQREKNRLQQAIKAEVKRRVPKYKAYPLPKLKAPAGFQSTAMNRFNNQGNVISDLQGVEGYLESVFGVTGEVTPLLTQADGTEVVNWGSPNAPQGVLTGLVDPSTGQPTKGIYDRLREIGNPGEMSESTLLGVEDKILAAQREQQFMAKILAGQLGPWVSQQDKLKRTDDNEVAWLAQAIDLTETEPSLRRKFPNLGKIPSRAVMHVKGAPRLIAGPGQVAVSKVIMDKVTEYRNAQAQIDRWTELKKQIPAERTREDRAVTTRTEDLRRKIQNGGTKRTYTNQELLQQQLNAIQNERDKALSKIPTAPPKGWKGDRKAWDQQHKQERADTTASYSARVDALRTAARKAGLAARLRKSDALFNLTRQAAIDRGTISTTLDNESTKLQDLITGERTTATSDKGWLTKLKESISAQSTQLKDIISTANGSDVSGALTAALDPRGQLSLDILTTKNVTIPSLLQEISQLKGTIIPPSDTGTDTGSASDTTASDNTSALLQIAQQQLANQVLANQVLSRQFGALRPGVAGAPQEWIKQAAGIGAIPSYGGSFATGGIVPGVMGEPRTVIAHAGERIIPVGGDQPAPTVHVHIDRKSDLDKLIDTRIAVKGANTARKVKYRQPSAGGGVGGFGR